MIKKSGLSIDKSYYRKVVNDIDMDGDGMIDF